MPDIYRLASRVIVWLGPEADDSTFALTMLCDSGRQMRIDWNTVDIQATNPQESDRSCRERLSKNLREPRVRKALRSLFDQPYFERLWVVQEIHFGRARGAVLCGRDCEEWALLEKGAFCWAELGEGSSRLIAVRNLCTNTSLMVSSLLRFAREAACSDPRDKVYAVLGMLRQSQRSIAEEIIPDYSKSVDQVYADTFRTICNREGHIELLTQAGVARDDNFRPTWSPDWSRTHKDPMLLQYADADADAKAKYSGNLCMQVCGCVAATVSTVGPTEAHTDFNVRRVFSWLRRLYKQASHAAPALSEKERLIVCSYVCVTGSIAEHFDPPASWVPRLQEVDSALRESVRCESTVKANSDSPQISENLVDEVYSSLHRRSILTTSEGHVGVGPD